MSDVVLTEAQAQVVLDALAGTPIGRAINVLLNASRIEDEPTESTDRNPDVEPAPPVD